MLPHSMDEGNSLEVLRAFGEGCHNTLIAAQRIETGCNDAEGNDELHERGSVEYGVCDGNLLAIHGRNALFSGDRNDL